VAFDLKDYVDVAERLREFYENHPQGRVVTSIVENTDKRVTVRAEVYREHQHSEPSGVGHSALGIPGATPYTRGAELENAETSAVGRALVMAGLASKRVSSADEISAKRGAVAPPDEALSEAATRIFADDDGVETYVAPAQQAGAEALTRGLADGVCPVHHKEWSLKPGGVSKTTNKPYGSFYACSEKDGAGWCKAKPKISWIAAQGGRQ
jgi:hypothetical protein